MNFRAFYLVISFTLLAFLPGCDIILGIYKAGFWSAIILIVLVAGLAFYGYKKYQGRD